MQPSPIIIYGAARSGTTYLTYLLNRHPDIFITNEARLFNWVYRSLIDLPQHENLVRHHRDEFVSHLRTRYPDLIREFYQQLRPTVQYWGDKNPHYAAPAVQGCLNTIEQLFPGTRFINIIRDGRDVVTSGLRGKWTDFDSVHEMWTTHLDIGCKFGRALPATQYFEMRYERLVRDDLAMAHRLFEFLQIPIAKPVIEFCMQQMKKRTPYCSPSRDIQDGATGSDWAKVLTPAQQLRSLELIGDRLAAFGYETADSLRQLQQDLKKVL